jgi:tyrosine-protein kinase Etk/Wzc
MKDNNITFLDDDDDTVRVRDFFYKYSFRWKWFLIGIVGMLLLSFLYLRYTSRQYQVFASILVNDKNTGETQSELSIFEDLGLINDSKSSFDNELNTLQSRSLLLQVIEELNLNVSFFKKGLVGTNEIYKDEFPFKINFLTEDAILRASKLEFTITAVSETEFSLENAETGQIQMFAYGATVSYDSCELIVIPLENNKEVSQERFIVEVVPVDEVVNQIKERVKIAPTDKKSSFINLSIIYPLKKKGIDILTSLIENYNKNAIVDKSTIAQKTNTFINERLRVISDDLLVLDKDVEVFKSANKITDIKSDTELVLKSNANLGERIVTAQTQIKLAEFVSTYIAAKKEEIIPINLGLSDVSIGETIQIYNGILLDRKRISKSSSAINPIIINLDQKLENLRTSIDESLVNLKSTLEISLQDLKTQEQFFESKIKSVPKQEREFREMQRQQQIIEALYLYLLQKREENSITLAVTTPNAKVIDSAYGSNIPISPKPIKTYLFFLVSGLLVPFAFIYVFSLFDNKVHNIADVERVLKMPMLGSIMNNKTKQKIVVSNKDKTALSESFRIVRTNILFMLSKLGKQSKVIFVTSTISGEGKTFVSANLATALALSNKKVLLIGGDIRNPELINYFDMKEKEGLTHFLVDATYKAEDLIEPVVNFNFDILQSGFIAPNPSELFMNGRFDELLTFGKEHYDFVIVDTAPVGLVTDTLLLSQDKEDLFVYVIRADYLDKRMLKIPQRLKKTNQIENLAILLNNTKPENIPGYGYVYGYGQNVSKPSWKDKIFRR